MKPSIFLIIYLLLLSWVISVFLFKKDVKDVKNLNVNNTLNETFIKNFTIISRISVNSTSTLECKQECESVAKIWGCFCDPICLDFKDCCNLYRKNCRNFFEQNSFFPNRNRTQSLPKFNNETVTVDNNIKNHQNILNNTNKSTNKTDETENSLQGSCCFPSMNMKCFCDSDCETDGDCCEDYLKCRALRKRNIKEGDSKTFSNFIEKDDGILNDKSKVLQPSKIWKSVLLPQIETRYFLSSSEYSRELAYRNKTE